MVTVDLFAGCGGMSLGFANAGFKVVAAYDFWKPATDTYAENFSDHEIYNFDLSQTEIAIEHISQWHPEIIIGGPPCQDFSHAGKREEGKRADLTNSFATIVCALKPEWFVMENVDRAIKSVAYKKTREKLEKNGYGFTEYVFDACLFGVPQKRKRFFCIGHYGDKHNFLLNLISKNQRTEPMTVREYLGASLGIEYYYRHPRNYNRRGIFSIDEPAPTVRGVNRPVPKGYKGHAGDPISKNCDLRPLTTHERSLLQTFPPNFKWVGSKTVAEQMIGNAVPVKLAEFVADRIFEYDQGLEMSIEGEDCHEFAQLELF